MPFIRYSRDKRGYESTVVLHAYRAGQGPPRTRVLYLFRSPSHAKIGRRPLDPEVMEALEHTHPDLTFDWSGLARDPAEPPKFEGRERYDRHAHRPGRSNARPAAQVAPVPVIIEDESTLGRLLGAQQALRLRARYSELIERITRRARNPEERDRLMERAVRLNPDEWSDDAVAQAAVRTFDDDWEAVAGDLPQRRRGRRGGRVRDGQGTQEVAAFDEGYDNEEQAAEPIVGGGTQGVSASVSGLGGRDGADAGGAAPGTGSDAGPDPDPSGLPVAG